MLSTDGHVMGTKSFESKHTQPYDSYSETGKRLSGCKPSRLAGAQAFQLGFEIGDAEEGGSQLAGLVSNFVFQPVHALP
jgi:hypothetical protein